MTIATVFKMRGGFEGGGEGVTRGTEREEKQLVCKFRNVHYSRLHFWLRTRCHNNSRPRYPMCSQARYRRHNLVNRIRKVKNRSITC
uniref:Uncharacterized protein n=1 Tax=Timema monikensis TaxID=170555 RepID=A0A7R9HNB5_9NEOP|nr:unnamed protein product [Timema monikensis]